MLATPALLDEIGDDGDIAPLERQRAFASPEGIG